MEIEIKTIYKKQEGFRNVRRLWEAFESSENSLGG